LVPIDQKIVPPDLPIAAGAEYNAYENRHDPKCHPGTRKDLLDQIKKWANDPHGESIFWLSGKAGTGKSTISRTLAESLNIEGKLSASFFFKRDEGDRSNASRFFTTIAAQILAHIPQLAKHVRDALVVNPTIHRRVMKEQFEKLIIEPLSKVHYDPSKPLVVVVDALDECSLEDDVRVIIFLLSRPKSVASVRLKFFLTSRPHAVIHREFAKMKGAFKSEILDMVDENIIERDIAAFLKSGLADIRDDYNLYPTGGESLPADWPSERDLQSLIAIAIPLFIFAATACLFIKAGKPDDPEEKLKSVLEHRVGSQTSKLDEMYIFILKQLLVHLAIPSDQMKKDFRVIIGSIIVLFDPLSTTCLAQLLQIPKRKIDIMVGQLPSVMNIPSDKSAPVRPLHLSFRDFLLDSEKREINPFWVDKAETHELLLTKCLELLLGSGHLKTNICGIEMPGTPRTDISSQKILECLPSEVQYACLYWIHHLKESGLSIQDGDQAHHFLEDHFLHWLEALSLIGRVPESIGLLDELERVVDCTKGAEFTKFIRDAKRFILNSRSAIEVAPLQLYYSALLFAPQNSLIRGRFGEQLDSWITTKPTIEHDWSPCLQTLDGHRDEVNSVAFSHDSKFLASGSNDRTIKIWDTATGSLQQTFESHDGDWVNSVAISHDSKLVASGTSEGIDVWDVATGSLKQTLRNSGDSVKSVAFSQDSAIIVSGLDCHIIEIWDVTNGFLKSRLQVPLKTTDGRRPVQAVAFSRDSKLIVSGLADGLLVWDATTGSVHKTLDDDDYVLSVAFSHDSTIKVYDVATGTLKQKFTRHGTFVYGVAISHDSKLIASAANSWNIKIWDTTTGQLMQALRCGGTVTSVAFSHDSKLIASGSKDHAVKIWDTTAKPIKTIEGSHTSRINSVAFSENAAFVASASEDEEVKTWDTATWSLQKSMMSINMARSVTVSFDVACSHLLTELGSIKLTASANFDNEEPFDAQAGSEVGSESREAAMLYRGCGLSLDNSWITWNGNNALWLPPEYRPYCLDVSSSGSPPIAPPTVTMITIGCRSGRVFLIGFSESGPSSSSKLW
ncbi:hypothetical protein BCR34DRAFT_498329, partial [Clohesyomyces aquaticus]